MFVTVSLKNCNDLRQPKPLNKALLRLHYCLPTLDDILLYGSGETVEEATRDHNRNMYALLQRCREKGIKLNSQKLQLNRKTTTFCGHQLTSNGVCPDPRKVEKFCPNFSSITAPLRALLQKENEFVWHADVHDVAFDKLN